MKTFRKLTVPRDADHAFAKAEILAKQMSEKYACEFSVYLSTHNYVVSASIIEDSTRLAGFTKGVPTFPFFTMESGSDAYSD